MVRLEDLQKTIEWLRDIESENVFYIDKDLKRELGNFINNLIKYTEQLKEDKKKAIEYIKESCVYDEDDGFEEKIYSLYVPTLLEILGDKENE